MILPQYPFFPDGNLLTLPETNTFFKGILATPPKATPPRNKALLRETNG